MKRLTAGSLVIVAAFALAVSPAGAAARKFKNCTAMHVVYKGGVERPGAVNKGGKLRYKPYVSLALYNANKSLDRDHDGIACER
jgi:hypothetical protein